ncbi:uncharacterized protein PRCAT00005499001 [Priceomyces carsonii]|uniref:uncharacterized protein n=1 Tax=Priceomyces carsonii TaxID=28549 RepID=UPI002ED8479D|nr:unnamed protein product [Priceomyces carsonii]
MTRHKKSSGNAKAKLLLGEESLLGDPWVPIYEMPVEFDAHHFESAMSNLIKQPNINSTVIMRADILKENKYDPKEGDYTFVSKSINEFPKFPMSDTEEGEILHRYLQDAELKSMPLGNSALELTIKSEVVRRIIPRNPFKDYIINQTCIILTNEDTVFVAYIPHIQSEEETPFYLPPVRAIGILYHKSKLSIHYLPFDFKKQDSLRSLDWTERPIRIALRLLETSSKHSQGAKDGYEKRVLHDLVVPKVAFQNRYISLKRKYSSQLVSQWCESTDPKKHVFEDIAIAAFLIELWSQNYKSNDEFEFRDLGCGNGLLVYILLLEGYKGQGIDARARKSWSMYPQEVQNQLKEQVLIPGVLLKPHPAVQKLAPHITDNGRYFQVPDKVSSHSEPLMTYHSAANLLQSPHICTTETFPPNTFIIGNHSDELTCWIPLLNFPFMVIPCCSHALNGAKVRYSPSKRRSPLYPVNVSTYSALVDHVEDLSVQMGWLVEKEMLRIPSTRNAALIGTQKAPAFLNISEDSIQTRVLDILVLEGGAEGWVENSMALMKKPPRSH